MTVKTLTYDELLITPTDIYEQMGYQGAWPDEATRQETQAIIDVVRTWLRPQFCFIVLRQLPAFDIGHIIKNQCSLKWKLKEKNLFFVQ